MTQVAEIVVVPKQVFFRYQACEIAVGFIDTDGFLKNISVDAGTSIDIVNGIAKLNYSGTAVFLTPFSTGSITLRITFATVHYFFSLVSVAPITAPSRTEIIRVVDSFVPPQAYTRSVSSAVYAKNAAAATVYETLSLDLKGVLLDNFPPFTTNNNWQIFLDDYYSWQDSFNFGLVVQLFRNILSQRGNTFDLTRLISGYIYARLGEQYYVYIQEDISVVEDWVLNYSILDVNTFLIGSMEVGSPVVVNVKVASLPVGFEAELLLFFEKIFATGLTVTLNLTTDFVQFGLVIETGDVYDEDPRLRVPYALKYNPSSVYDVECLFSPYAPIFLVGFNYTPPGGTYPADVTTLTLEAVAVYEVDGTFYPLNVSSATVFTSDDVFVATMTDNILSVTGEGTANIEAVWTTEDVTHPFTFTPTSSWILDISSLDADTILL